MTTATPTVPPCFFRAVSEHNLPPCCEDIWDASWCWKVPSLAVHPLDGTRRSFGCRTLTEKRSGDRSSSRDSSREIASSCKRCAPHRWPWDPVFSHGNTLGVVQHRSDPGMGMQTVWSRVHRDLPSHVSVFRLCRRPTARQESHQTLRGFLGFFDSLAHYTGLLKQAVVGHQGSWPEQVVRTS